MRISSMVSNKEGFFRSTTNYNLYQVIARNFPEDYDMSEERRFDQLYASDQYRQRHLLPFFLSVITPPDSNQLTGVRNPDTGILELPKGIRTLQEVAHFVRCLPFRGSQDYFSTSAEAGDQSVWASADFVLALRRASLEEHAILMASMFRAVKFEVSSCNFSQVVLPYDSHCQP